MNLVEYDYDLQELKDSLEDWQVFDLLAEFGGDPQTRNGVIVSRTICHEGQSHKLYYYNNTHLFRCFTDCGATFDIFELVQKVKSRELGAEYPLSQAIEFVAQKFGFSKQVKDDLTGLSIVSDLKYFNSYDRIKNIDTSTQTVELKIYDGSFLKNLPSVDILPWIEDNISRDTMDYYGIKYDPKNQGVIIPHYDINGNLIGIRERTLIAEVAETYGKYLPMKVGGKTYSHPLSFNLYGLYQNKDNIKRLKKAIILESEKAVLQLDGILGRKNNVGVACCGSSVLPYQISLLESLGVTEVIIGLDHDFYSVNDDSAKKKINNLKNIQKKFGQYMRLSYLWDRENLTGYKCSPTDCGKDIFMKLYSDRINLY